MHPFAFIVVSPGPQHGKSTVRDAITALTGLKGASCSDVIYRLLSAKRGVDESALRELPKEALRADLIALGDWLCGFGGLDAPAAMPNAEAFYRNPSFLVRSLFGDGFRVIDGVRRRGELQDAVRFFKQREIQPYVVHVERAAAPRIRDNSADLRGLADFCLKNDGTVEELNARVSSMLNLWGVTSPLPGRELFAA